MIPARWMVRPRFLVACVALLVAPASLRSQEAATPPAAGSDLLMGPCVTQVSDTAAKVLWVSRAGAAGRCEVLAGLGAA